MKMKNLKLENRLIQINQKTDLKNIDKILKKRKRKNEMMNRKNRIDPNAPQFNRIPLPEM